MPVDDEVSWSEDQLQLSYNYSYPRSSILLLLVNLLLDRLHDYFGQYFGLIRYVLTAASDSVERPSQILTICSHTSR
jgi:hypothetical protein